MVSSPEDFVGFVSAKLPGLRRTAFLLCGDWDRGDDIVQQTITELYLRWDRACAADNLDAYVRTVLVRRYLDQRRRWWSRVRLTDELPDLPEWASSQPDHALRLDMRAALRRLAPRQRAVLVLRYFHGLSVEETAQALGCAAGTVKSQTSRALVTMRGLLGPAFDTDEARNHG